MSRWGRRCSPVRRSPTRISCGITWCRSMGRRACGAASRCGTRGPSTAASAARCSRGRRVRHHLRRARADSSPSRYLERYLSRWRRRDPRRQECLAFTLINRRPDAWPAHLSQIDLDRGLRHLRRPVRARHGRCVCAVSAHSVSAASSWVLVSADGCRCWGSRRMRGLPGWPDAASSA